MKMARTIKPKPMPYGTNQSMSLSLDTRASAFGRGSCVVALASAAYA